MILLNAVLGVGIAVGGVYALILAWASHSRAMTGISAATGVGCIVNAYTQANSVVGGLPELPMVFSLPFLTVSVLGWIAIISPQLQDHEARVATR